MTGRARRGRGLTLVETLVAAALLAVIAATCVPHLRECASALARGDAGTPHPHPHGIGGGAAASPPSWGAPELGALADLVAERPARFGIGPGPGSGDGPWTVAWPAKGEGLGADPGARPEVTVTALPTPPPAADGADAEPDTRRWVLLECDGRVAVRRLRERRAEPDARPAPRAPAPSGGRRR